MREFRFILGRRALIVFLALLVATGTLLGVPSATRILAESPLPVSREMSAADSVTAEEPILDPSGPPPLLQAGSGDIWTEVNTPIDPTTTPTARNQHTMAALPSGDVLLFGGFGNGSFNYLNDTWLFNTASNTWGQITSTGSTPSARNYHAMAATPSGALLFGGSDSSNPRLDDTWLFDTGTNSWSQVSTSPTPTARYGHAMAALPSGDVLLFGGEGMFNVKLDDTWLFDTGTDSWSQVSTSPTPTARYGHAMAATSSGALLFGGAGDSGFLDDTWTLTLARIPDTDTGTWFGTWTQRTGSSTPTARMDHAMAATPSRDVLLFGGNETGTYAKLNDTWLFDTASNSWGELTLTNSPPPRHQHAMATTPSGVLLFGGYDTSSRLGDTWLFSPGEEPSTPTIAVTSPTAGATWVVGQTASITWTSTDLTGTTTIELSRDTGTNWVTLTTTTPSQGTFTWTVTGLVTSINCFIRVTNGTTTGTSGQFTITAVPTISVTSPTADDLWAIGSSHAITWTSTGLNSNTLTILLARDGVNFTETITHGLAYDVLQHPWTVSGPGTINAKIRVQQDATEGTSPGFFTITSTLFPYVGGTTTLTTSDPWLEISGGAGTGTLWVTPLTPTNTSDPNLNLFMQGTGKRSALFFDIGQENLTGTLTIVLHFNHQLGEETFVLYLWDETNRKWVNVPGIPPSPDPTNHTFTFQILASDLTGTPFGLGGNPAAMPSMSPWALALLSLALLGASGWWFLRRRRLA